MYDETKAGQRLLDEAQCTNVRCYNSTFYFGSKGLQKFDGEDLNNKARTKYQQEQLREWSEKQKQEREQADANQV